MVYVKSLLAGVAALLISVLLLPVGLTAVNLSKTPTSASDKALTWDFREALNLRPWQIWLCILIIFGLGFYWEFRRASP
jgi:hypothetical protein